MQIFLATCSPDTNPGSWCWRLRDTYGTHRSLERGAEKLLRILREQFAFVVVDAGSCSGNIPDTLHEMSNIVYLVTEVNLPALRNARRLISWFDGKRERSDLEVVLNRFNSREVEIDEDSTAKALSRPVDWKIPNDYMSVRGAQNLGIPLVTQDTPFARAVRQMAKRRAQSSLRPQRGRRRRGPERRQMEILDFEKYKATVHSALLSQIDLERLAAVDNGKARHAVAVLVQEIVLTERVPLNADRKGDRSNPTCLMKFSAWGRWNRC